MDGWMDGWMKERRDRGMEEKDGWTNGRRNGRSLSVKHDDDGVSCQYRRFSAGLTSTTVERRVGMRAFKPNKNTKHNSPLAEQVFPSP